MQKRLGIKSETKKRVKTRVKKTSKRKKSSGHDWINPVTGRKERFNPWGI